MLTVGEILKRERLNKKLTLEDIEKATKIRIKNLLAIENSDWKKLPSKTYITGIINTYCNYLSLDAQKMNAFFRREYGRKEDIQFKSAVDNDKVVPQKKKNFRFLVLIVALIFLTYFGYQIKLYLTPPKVTIISPTQQNYTIEDRIEIVGKTEKEAIVYINKERIYLDNNNVFKTFVPLSKPKNLVVIEAIGANGKKTVVQRIYTKKIK